MNGTAILKICAVLLFSLCLVSCDSGKASYNSSGTKASASSKPKSLETACSALQMKIANGTTCSAGDLLDSSVVRLLITDPMGNVFSCSGTAVTPNIVVTAAHCLINGIQSVEVDTFSGNFPVAGYVVPSSLSTDETQSYIFNDVAIVGIAGKLTSFTAPLLISRSVAAGETSLVAGYGDNFAPTVNSVQVGWTTIENVTPNHIFVHIGPNSSGPCHGDSGGPLFVWQNGEAVLTGVASQNDPSNFNAECTEEHTTLYTNLQNPEVFGFISAHAGGLALR